MLFSAGCLHHRQRRASAPVPVASSPSAPTPKPSKPSGPAITGVTPPGTIVQGEEGIATWYGYPYHGRYASSGEVYNMYDLTAAHRTLPFNTMVRVHDLENGRTVDVRINDRGPFIEGRIIDLSYTGAQAIDMVGTGSALVRLEILNPGLVSGPAAASGLFGVQVGSFSDQSHAEQFKQRIVAAGFNPVSIQTVNRGDVTLYRVRVGSQSEAAARALAGKLKDANLVTETFVVRLN